MKICAAITVLLTSFLFASGGLALARQGDALSPQTIQAQTSVLDSCRSVLARYAYDGTELAHAATNRTSSGNFASSPVSIEISIVDSCTGAIVRPQVSRNYFVPDEIAFGPDGAAAPLSEGAPQPPPNGVLIDWFSHTSGCRPGGYKVVTTTYVYEIYDYQGNVTGYQAENLTVNLFDGTCEKNTKPSR
ncbi:MAG TPA: hypothetical protein VFN09_03825 [Rhodanobacteraceae bacterium]|nr:hypothetical protein [Rhodanobacteraceae bacterium]